MSSKNQVATWHPPLGGLDITSDATILSPDFLTEATNIEYQEDGRRKKRAGIIQYSPTSSYAGTTTNVMVSTGLTGRVRAFSDVWTYGNALTPVQRIVSVTGASIFRSTGDGLWTALSATSSFGTASNLNTNITLGQDYAVISDGVSAPIAYNAASTTLVAATTGALWPVFEHSRYHLNRLFIGGVSTAPNEVQYMADGNIFDSTGADTGRFVFDAGDGDRVMGMSKPFFESIYVFKGPQFGSIHRLEGKTPTTFARSKITSGAPVISNRTIITTANDVFWLSKYGAHSLQTTIKYGDVEQAFISLPIQSLWRDGLLDINKLSDAVGFWNPTRNIIGWLVTPATTFPFGTVGSVEGKELNVAIVYNFALSDPAPGGKKFWSIWTLPFSMASANQVIQPLTPIPGEVTHSHLYLGGRGFVYFAEYAQFEDETLAFDMRIRTPNIMRLPQAGDTQEKLLVGVTSYIGSRTGGTAKMRAFVDGRSQTKTIDLSAVGATLT